MKKQTLNPSKVSSLNFHYWQLLPNEAFVGSGRFFITLWSRPQAATRLLMFAPRGCLVFYHTDLTGGFSYFSRPSAPDMFCRPSSCSNTTEHGIVHCTTTITLQNVSHIYGSNCQNCSTNKGDHICLSTPTSRHVLLLFLSCTDICVHENISYLVDTYFSLILCALI